MVTLGGHTLDTVVGADVWIGDERPEDAYPRGVVRQVVVELGGEGLDLGQASPRHVGEIVVLVVVADVEAEGVERTIVRKRLVAVAKDVVFRDEVAGERVQ